MKKYFVWAVLCMASVCLSSCSDDDEKYGDVDIPEMEMSELAGTWKGTIAEYDGKHSYTFTFNGKGGVESVEKYGKVVEKGSGTTYLSTADDGCHLLYMYLKIPMEGGIASRTIGVHVKWAKADRRAIFVSETNVFKKQ